MAKGIKYGREITVAVPEPLDGELYAGQVEADGPNQWLSMASASTPIEGVVVKALADNSGTVYVQGRGGSSVGYPLAAGETVSIAIDDLIKVAVWAPTSGDGVAWLAIRAAEG